MPLLSVAMMVRNEERHLERCLKSLAPLHAEIVIVDTGSSDKTVAIAERFTKKIFHSPWRNDFSFHRNESFSHATGDWILQIDADEEIVWADPENGPAYLADFLRAVPKDDNTVIVPLRDWRESAGRYSGEIDVPRIFRRGKVTYRRRVHNDPVFEGRIVAFKGFYLKHYGYDLTPAQCRAKADRTIPLLVKSLEEDPDDHDCHFYLMNAYKSWLGDDEKAIQHGLEYIDRQEKMGDAFNETVFHSLASMFIAQDKLSDARDMINQGLARWSLNVDLWYDTFKIALKEKDPLSVAKASQNYIHSARQFITGRNRRIGQFFFHVDPDSIANGLFYLTLSYFENGANELINLKNILPLCRPATREEMEQKMAECMMQLKLEDTSERRLIVTPGSEATWPKDGLENLKKAH